MGDFLCLLLRLDVKQNGDAQSQKRLTLQPTPQNHHFEIFWNSLFSTIFIGQLLNFFDHVIVYYVGMYPIQSLGEAIFQYTGHNYYVVELGRDHLPLFKSQISNSNLSVWTCQNEAFIKQLLLNNKSHFYMSTLHVKILVKDGDTQNVVARFMF